MDRITLTIGDRTIYWEIPREVAAVLGQTLVASLGPARED